MAYSRWSNSFWYTFWSSSVSNKKEDQIFEICDFGHSMTFKYSDMASISSCIKKVKAHFGQKIIGSILSDFGHDEVGKVNLIYKEHTHEGVELNEEQLNELEVYMLKFIEDVNEEYKDDDKKAS